MRLIHNAEPKPLYLACNVPLDVTVDRTVTWREFVHEATGRMDNGRRGKGRRGIVTPTTFETKSSNILHSFRWMNAAFVQQTAARSAEIAPAWAFAG